MCLFGFNDPTLRVDLGCHFFMIADSFKEVAGKEIDLGTKVVEDVLETRTVDASGAATGAAASSR